MQEKLIKVLTTGGTIEKSYDEFDGSLKNRSSVIKERILSRLRLPHTRVEILDIMAKDSLEMTDSDRQLLYDRATAEMSQELPKALLILHGTDTMEVTAAYFHQRAPSPPVPIIFTGAMRPLGFENSDAMQNFIEAMMACQMALPGIYISFHNHLFPVPGVKKNRNLGTFEAT